MKEFKHTKLARKLVVDRWASKDMEKYFVDKSVEFKNKLMLDVMKGNYLYFERVRITDKHNIYVSTIENVNLLRIKPKTNSSGVWGFTMHHTDNGKTLCKDQYWIDFNKLDNQPEKQTNLILQAISQIIDKI